MKPEPTHLDPVIRAWLDEPVHIPEDGLADALRRAHETPQQQHWWPASPTRRSRSMFTAPRIIIAGAIFALVGGAFLAGLPGTRPAEPVPLPAATSEDASPSPVPSLEPIAFEVLAQDRKITDAQVERVWELLTYRDAAGESQTVPADTDITLSFFAGAAGGKLACGSFETEYSRQDATFAADLPVLEGTTSCDPVDQALDADIYRGLGEAASLMVADKTLTLFDVAGETLMTFSRQ